MLRFENFGQDKNLRSALCSWANWDQTDQGPHDGRCTADDSIPQYIQRPSRTVIEPQRQPFFFAVTASTAL
jgi:hypothetical protein